MSRGKPLLGRAALATATLVMASGFAAWIAEVNPIDWLLGPELAHSAAALSFEDRFGTDSTFNSTSIYYRPRRARPRLADFETEFQHVTDELATLSPDAEQDQAAAPDQSARPASAAVAAIPLPKSRPMEANLLKDDPPPVVAEKREERTLWQKFTDLMPARLSFASLEPNGGLLRRGPNLAALGYDSTTAVYDITARAVYLPNGSALEAHSGLGRMMDDPAHVDQRMNGATPPGIYEMKPREKLFHGVPALRLTPVDGSDALGRTGLLAHSYMLGPNGDSNGCVSIRDYDRFLKAYRDGEIKRLVVVTTINDRVLASAQTKS